LKSEGTKDNSRALIRTAFTPVYRGVQLMGDLKSMTVPAVLAVACLMLIPPVQSVAAGDVLRVQGTQLLWGERPVKLVGFSYYGAVADPDLDIDGYLDALAAHSITLTRIFLIDKWANGGDSYTPFKVVNGKYDLTQYDNTYFSRLRHFVQGAERRGIAVQIALFDRCGLQNGPPERFGRSPYNAANNVNGLLTAPARGYPDFLQMDGTKLGEINRALVNKIVSEIGDRGNVIYEIMNEPIFGWRDSVEWHLWVARILRDAFEGRPGSKVISACYRDQRILDSPLIDAVSTHHVRDFNKVRNAVARIHASGKVAIVSDDGDSWSMDNPQNCVKAAEFALSLGASFEHLSWPVTRQGEDQEPPITGIDAFPTKAVSALKGLGRLAAQQKTK